MFFNDKTMLYGLIGVTGLIAVVLIGAFVVYPMFTEAPLPKIRKAPDFTLVNQENESVSLSDFSGKVVLLGFIYTHCPDADFCIAMMNIYAQIHNELKDQGILGKDVFLLTITLDPIRDTPQVLKAYGESYGAAFSSPIDGWQFLTGDNETVTQVLLNYGVIAFPESELNSTSSLASTTQSNNAGSLIRIQHEDHNNSRIIHNFVTYLIDQNGWIRQQYERPSLDVSNLPEGYSKLEKDLVLQQITQLLREENQ